MTDDDLLHDRPNPEFGSGIIGVCDVCGRRQAVIVLQKERFQLCVLDFLNKSWTTSGRKPSAALPPYRSERVWFPTRSDRSGKAPAVLLVPTRVVRHPIVLVTPDVFGLTTAVLDGAIRFAREGFEVLLPDLGRYAGVGPSTHVSLRIGTRTRGGVVAESRRVAELVALYRDALAYLRSRELADPTKVALFGVSYGASLAALVAAQEPSITAVALASPRPIRPPELVRVVHAPIAAAFGAADPAGRTFAAETRAALGDRTPAPLLLEIPGAHHTFPARDLPGYDLAAAEAGWNHLVGFLKQQLLPPPPKPPAPPTPRTAAAAPTTAAAAAGPPASAA